MFSEIKFRVFADGFKKAMETSPLLNGLKDEMKEKMCRELFNVYYGVYNLADRAQVNVDIQQCEAAIKRIIAKKEAA